MNSFTIRPLALWLLGLSAVLILGGVSLLLGSHPIAPALPAPGEGESVAYSSNLVIALDGASWISNPLAVWGAALLVGGLMVSAAAAGLRWGRGGAGHE